MCVLSVLSVCVLSVCVCLVCVCVCKSNASILQLQAFFVFVQNMYCAPSQKSMVEAMMTCSSSKQGNPKSIENITPKLNENIAPNTPKVKASAEKIKSPNKEDLLRSPGNDLDKRPVGIRSIFLQKSLD